MIERSPQNISLPVRTEQNGQSNMLGCYECTQCALQHLADSPRYTHARYQKSHSQFGRTRLCGRDNIHVEQTTVHARDVRDIQIRKPKALTTLSTPSASTLGPCEEIYVKHEHCCLHGKQILNFVRSSWKCKRAPQLCRYFPVSSVPGLDARIRYLFRLLLQTGLMRRKPLRYQLFLTQMDQWQRLILVLHILV